MSHKPEVDSERSPLPFQFWWRAYNMWSKEYLTGNRTIRMLKSNNLWPQNDEESSEEWDRCITAHAHRNR